MDFKNQKKKKTWLKPIAFLIHPDYNRKLWEIKDHLKQQNESSTINKNMHAREVGSL